MLLIGNLTKKKKKNSNSSKWIKAVSVNIDKYYSKLQPTSTELGAICFQNSSPTLVTTSSLLLIPISWQHLNSHTIKVWKKSYFRNAKKALISSPIPWKGPSFPLTKDFIWIPVSKITFCWGIWVYWAPWIQWKKTFGADGLLESN